MFENIDVVLGAQIQNFLKGMDRIAIGVNIFEIVILFLLLYYLFNKFIRGTQSESLVRGSLVLVVLWGVSELLIKVNLQIFGTVLKALVSIVAFGLIVIFQPELRRLLAYIGQGNLIEKIFTSETTFSNEKKIDVVQELIETVKYLSKTKTGGLILLEKDETWHEGTDIGVKINADLSQELLLTIFFPKTPLHDGAVVVRNDKIISAGVVLPLTENPKLSWRYGTRHRAAIGATESNPDCACIVISEETGDVSVALDGILRRYEDIEKLKSDLMRILGYKEEEKPLFQNFQKNFIKFDNIFGKNL